MKRELREDLEPVSMYTLFARMFAHLSKEVVERFGEEGKSAIEAGVWNFGEERGRNIAKRAKANGAENDVANYLISYDMGRSDDFECENVYGDNQVEQLFTRCVFADQWKADHMEEYGLLYCKNIDPSIAKGYNKKLECVHDKHFYTDGVCSFCFRMEEQ